MQQLYDDPLWNGEAGAGGISWIDRSRMGPLRGVIDAADDGGRRNAYMHALHVKVLERELRITTGRIRRALDFGCGTGRMLRTLHAHGDLVYGVDREPAMVEAATRYASAFAARIECWRADEMPFPAQFFDFVLSSSVLCVTPARLFEPSLCEIARVARPKATLLLLEQIAPARGLTLRRYFFALQEAGFEALSAYPIRAASSRFTKFAANHAWLPRWSFGVVARLELATAKRHRHTASAAPYVEYAIVARRVS